MKEILKFLNEAKWYIIIVISITIIVTVLVTIIMNRNQRISEPKEPETVINKVEFIDPPVTFLLNIPENIDNENNIGNINIANIEEIKKLYTFEDFHKKIDFYFKKNILKNKVDLLFENY